MNLVLLALVLAAPPPSIPTQLTCPAGQVVTISSTGQKSCTATVVASGLVCTDCVALTAETTGGYAASASEAGPATTALALNADPADCGASTFAHTIAASGALTCSTVPDAALASNYSGVGACAANAWASTLNDNAAPTCTQPAFTNLSGAAADSQVPDNVTLSPDATAGLLLTAASGAASNPASNLVRMYVREDIDLGSGAATADCGIRALLQSGVEVTVVVLTTDAGCP